MQGKILVIDDEKSIRESVKEILTQEGFTVRVAGSATDAWKKIKNWNPEMLILDILFPGEGIKSFVKRLDKEIENIKIIYLSVYSKSAAKRLGYLGLSEKIVGYVEKPFSISELLEIVENALQEDKTKLQSSLSIEKLFQRIKGQLDKRGIADLKEEFPAQSTSSIQEVLSKLDSENEVIVSSSKPTLVYSSAFKMKILKQVVQFYQSNIKSVSQIADKIGIEPEKLRTIINDTEKVKLK